MKLNTLLLASIPMLALQGPLTGCTGDKPPETADADADADADTDTDADADVIDLPAVDDWVWGEALASDAIDEAGDRDLFRIEATEGQEFFLATAAYYLDEDSEPDTVLQLFDADMNLLAENDDMPLRFWETDSALYFQATYNGDYFVQVLEWSDWADYDELYGGSDFEYELWGAYFYVEDAEPNDDADAADALFDDEETNPGFYSSFVSDSIGEFFGVMQDDGDIDVWTFEFSGNYYYTFSFWPTTFGDLAPQLSLYDASWNLLATTDDPAFTTEGTLYYYNYGLLYPVEEGERYYVVVEDNNGGSGAGTFYPAFHTGYSYDSSSLTDNRSRTTLSPTWSESTDYPGYWNGYSLGQVDSDEDYDLVSVSSSSVGDLEGRYLSIYVAAKRFGSLLGANLVVTDSDGNPLGDSSNWTVDSSGDVEVWDIELPDVSTVLIYVEPEEAGDVDESNYYIIRTALYDSPLN